MSSRTAAPIVGLVAAAILSPGCYLKSVFAPDQERDERSRRNAECVYDDTLRDPGWTEESFSRWLAEERPEAWQVARALSNECQMITVLAYLINVGDVRILHNEGRLEWFGFWGYVGVCDYDPSYGTGLLLECRVRQLEEYANDSPIRNEHPASIGADGDTGADSR